MQSSNNVILKEIYNDLMDEKKSVQKLLDKNLSCIDEIDKYLDSLYGKENSEFKVFSPRSLEIVHKDNIENNKSKKRSAELENQSYYKRLNKLDKYLAGLGSVIQSCEEDVGSESIYSFQAMSQKQDSARNLQVLDIQEKERQRIARDLHDTSLQNLAHLVHKIELSSMFIDQDPLRAKLELAAVKKNLKSVMEEMRNTIFDLRPMSFDDLGLNECFERMFAKLKDANKTIDFITDIQNTITGNDLVLMTIFRLVQECCSNAIKHSDGDKIYVTVKIQEDKYCLSVKDNGVGFDMKAASGKENRHFGLKVMKERVELLGGNICICSSKDNGTEVKIEIPMDCIRGLKNEH